MLYAERNELGKITAVRTTPATPDQEQITDEELIDFFNESGNAASYQTLLSLLDTRIVRVLDDLIDVLVDKNVIRFTDLPIDAQKKIGERKKIRQKLQSAGGIMVDNSL